MLKLSPCLYVVAVLIAALGLALWDRARLQDDVIVQSSRIVTLQGAVEAQNTAILDLSAKGQALEVQAAAAARAVLLAGEHHRAALPAGHGPAVMNLWLRETFRPEVRDAP